MTTSSVVKNLVSEISDDLNVSADRFVQEDFDVRTFTSAILKSQQLTEHLTKLALNIKLLDNEIKDQVSEHHEDLLHQAIHVETLEGILDMVQTRIGSLKATSDRLRLKIETPFNELSLRIRQLSRLQAACDTLRRIKGVLNHSARLRQHMQSREILKAAQCLNELEFLLRDLDHQGLKIIEDDVHFLHKSRHEVEEQAQTALEAGLLQADQIQVGTGLQVFYSLGVLGPKLSQAKITNERQFQKRLNQLLDTTSLTLQSTGNSSSSSALSTTSSSSQLFPGRATMPNVGAMGQFRANLWSNVEKLMDALFDSCAQVCQLQQILEKKKDLLTNSLYVDEIELTSGSMFLADSSGKVVAYESIRATIDDRTSLLELLYEQWRQLTTVLSSCLLSACNQSNYVKQTFQNEYPKLLKLQNDFWQRLVQLWPLVERYRYTGDKQGGKERLGTSYLSSYDLLRKCFIDLENAYLNRSLSNLFDPINLIFSQNLVDKPISRSDIDTFIKGVQSQLQTLQYDQRNTTSSFSDKVVSNLCKSFTMFANKSEQTLSSLNAHLTSTHSLGLSSDSISQTDSAFSGYSFICLQPSPLQLKTLDFLNTTHDLYIQLGQLFDSAPRVSQVLSDKLSNSLQSLVVFEENALQPFFASASNHVLAILLTLHQEDFVINPSKPFNPATPSLYINELHQVLMRICRDFLRRFSCTSIIDSSLSKLAIRIIELFVRHTSILRPLSDKTRQRLVTDSLQIETSIQTLLCPKLTDLGLAYKQLKAFRHLLQTQLNLSDENVYTALVGESLPYSVLLTYLFSYGPTELKSPHQSLDWSPSKYSDWMDRHGTEKERVMVVKTCLEAYVNGVNQRGEKQFAEVYPLILKLLEKGLQSV